MPTATEQLIGKDLLTSDNPAVIRGEQSVSYQQLFKNIDTYVTHLKSFGVNSGDRVALLSPNTLEHIIALLSLWSMKAVACPINIRLPQNAIEDQLKQINAQYLITSEPFECKAPAKHLNFLEITDSNTLSSYAPSNNFFTEPNRDATIIFTTGSNGYPKAVLHTFKNHTLSALSSNEMIPLVPGDRWLLSLPLYHVGGLSILFRSFLAGATVVVAKTQSEAIQSIKNGGITHISCVSTQLARLLDDECCPKLKDLKALLVGGSAISDSHLKKAFSLNIPIYTTYGLTEMASQVATAKYPHSAKILKNADVKISSNGEILVRGGTLFKGYVEGNKIICPVDSDGWFQTGDIGNLTKKDGLLVKGRKDNMFISGGENIQPEEIESTLTQLDQIEQAVIVPIQNDEFGFRPVGMLKLCKDQSLKRNELINFLSNRLPKYKIPDHFFNWPNEKKASYFKVNRQYLSQHFLNNTTDFQEID